MNLEQHKELCGIIERGDVAGFKLFLEKYLPAPRRSPAGVSVLSSRQVLRLQLVAALQGLIVVGFTMLCADVAPELVPVWAAIFGIVAGRWWYPWALSRRP